MTYNFIQAIGILQDWCKKKHDFNIYDFKFRNYEYPKDIIVFNYYSEKLNDISSIVFHTTLESYEKHSDSFKIHYLLSDVITSIRNEKINTILNKL